MGRFDCICFKITFKSGLYFYNIFKSFFKVIRLDDKGLFMRSCSCLVISEEVRIAGFF